MRNFLSNRLQFGYYCLSLQRENRPFKTPFYVNVMNEGVKL